MNSRLLLNLFLLLCVSALGAFIIYSPDNTDDDITRISNLAASDINNITIQRDGLADIFLEKVNNTWWMTNPYKVPANPVPIESLLTLPNAISHSRFSATGKNLRDYNLLPAKASLNLNGKEYLFGNIEHINKRRYILHNHTVHLTTDLFYHRLRTNIETYISPKLLADDLKITSLKLPEFEINQSAKGEWLISGNKSIDNIPTDSVQILLDHWKNKQAIQVQPAKIIGDEKIAQLTFSDNSIATFLIRNTNNYFILIRKDLGLQYQLPKKAANDLLSLKTP